MARSPYNYKPGGDFITEPDFHLEVAASATSWTRVNEEADDNEIMHFVVTAESGDIRIGWSDADNTPTSFMWIPQRTTARIVKAAGRVLYYRTAGNNPNASLCGYRVGM